MSAPQSKLVNLFETRLDAMNISCERVLKRSNDFLSKLDKPKKSSVFMLERLINLCQNELELLEKEKDSQFYGEFSNHIKLTEAQESLKLNLSKLEDAKKSLQDKGYKDVSLLIKDDLLATNNLSNDIFQQLVDL